MPNNCYWKITWQTDLAHWLDYNSLRDIRRIIKQEVRLFPNGKTLLFLYLKSATSRSKMSCIFTRADTIAESSRFEFEEAQRIYMNSKRKRDEILNSENNQEKNSESSDETEKFPEPPRIEKSTPARFRREESPFSLKKKVKREASPPSINMTTTDSLDEDSGRTLSSILPQQQETAKVMTKEDIVLKILNGDSVARILTWCKITKNAKLFMLIHDNISEFQSMEKLLRSLDLDSNCLLNSNCKMFSEL